MKIRSRYENMEQIDSAGERGLSGSCLQQTPTTARKTRQEACRRACLPRQRLEAIVLYLFFVLRLVIGDSVTLSTAGERERDEERRGKEDSKRARDDKAHPFVSARLHAHAWEYWSMHVRVRGHVRHHSSALYCWPVLYTRCEERFSSVLLACAVHTLGGTG